MPDQIINNPELNTYNGFYIPTEGLPTSDFLAEVPSNINDLGPTGDQFAASIASGQTITDLMNDLERFQDYSENLINNYPHMHHTHQWGSY